MAEEHEKGIDITTGREITTATKGGQDLERDGDALKLCLRLILLRTEQFAPVPLCVSGPPLAEGIRSGR